MSCWKISPSGQKVGKPLFKSYTSGVPEVAKRPRVLLPALHRPDVVRVGPLVLVGQVEVVVVAARDAGRPERVGVLLVEPEAIAHVRFELVLS